MTNRDVEIRLEGKDRHGQGCGCGVCNANGHAYEAAVYVDGEKEQAFYGPSEGVSLSLAERYRRELVGATTCGNCGDELDPSDMATEQVCKVCHESYK